MRHDSLSGPGVLRRWWWHTSQRARLTTTGIATVAGMAVTALVLSSVLHAPRGAVPALAQGLPAGDLPAGPTRSPTAADRRIIVTSVRAVDLIDGTDAAANRPVAIRVAGIHSVPDCWAGQARTRAMNFLSGKQVWLLADGVRTDPDGRVHAMVLLPDGHDYAYTVVNAGAALAGSGPSAAADQGDLKAAEDNARRVHKGWWGASCAATTTGEGATSSSVPSTGQEPQTSGGPATPTVAGTPEPQPPVPTSSTAPPAGDDVQQGVRLGDPCSPPDARGVTDHGQDAVCTGKAGEQAKWRKA